MKQIKLVVLSLAALALGRPTGLCTANTQAEDIAALQKRLDDQEAELGRLRTATKTPAEPEIPSATALLIKGAGVEAEDVNWRIRAGLSPAQAVEVAAMELAERKAGKKEAKK